MIEVEQMSYGYGSSLLLSGVSLKLAPGSFHFLIGPSGAGKTTLIRLLCGELLATEGRINLFGQDSQLLLRNDMANLRRQIGVVHQDCQFLDHLTVTENILMPLTVSGRSLRDPNEVNDLLAWVGLLPQAHSLPPELSGGERQRAALARSVIMAPDVVIADEPTGNVDWDMSLRLLKLLVELNRLGKTIVIATHDMNLIRSAKSQVQARVLRIANKQLQLAGADL